MSKKTLVLGASTKKERYSNKATELLLKKGHEVSLLGNSIAEIYGQRIVKDWQELEKENVNTVTVYLSPKNQKGFYNKIIDLNPERVIFNPGTENLDFYDLLKVNNIDYEEACTLVLLNLGVY